MKKLVTAVAEVEVDFDMAYAVIAALSPDDVSAMSEEEVVESYVQVLINRGVGLDFCVSCVTEYPS